MDKTHALRGRKQSPEHISKRNRPCQSGCTCKKHTSWEAGVEAAKAGTARAAAAGVFKERSKKISNAWADKSDEEKEAWRKKCSEAKKAEWAKAKAEGRRRNKHYGSRKRTSKHELALVPYMEALGYKHDTGKRVEHKVPDFVDQDGKRIYEYFGTYWHESGDDKRLIEFYALRGWECKVLWESDLYQFLLDNQHLVTDEQHEFAWRAAKVNNGFTKPPPLNR